MVLAAENDETRQTVSLLVACLVGIAVALTALTVWYWFHTDPKRRRQVSSSSTDRSPIVEGVPAHRQDDAAARDRLRDRADTTASMVDEQPSADRSADEPIARDDPDPDFVPVAGPGGLGGNDGATDDVDRGAAEAVATNDQADEFVTGPLMARQTWDFVAAAKRAEDGGRPAVPPPPAAPRIAVPRRPGLATVDGDEADELAVVRRRREQEAARGLSDEVWDSVRRSVFDKLDG